MTTCGFSIIKFSQFNLLKIKNECLWLIQVDFSTPAAARGLWLPQDSALGSTFFDHREFYLMPSAESLISLAGVLGYIFKKNTG